MHEMKQLDPRNTSETMLLCYHLSPDSACSVDLCIPSLDLIQIDLCRLLHFQENEEINPYIAISSSSIAINYCICTVSSAIAI